MVPSDAAITAVERGQGAPIVLVHGALGDHRQWAPIVDRLAGRHRAIALSRRHHWPHEGPPPGAEYTYESHRDDLLAWLPSAGAAVHLVGHSYGAGVALLAALARPDLMRALVLIEPAFGSVLPDADDELQPEVSSRRAAMAEVQALAREGRHGLASERLIDWVQGGPGGFARLPEAVRRALLDNAATIGPTFATTARNVTRERLRALRVRTLVLNGEATRAWYRRIGDAVAASIPGAERGTIPSAAHMAIVENPEATARLIDAFAARRAADG